MRDLILTGFPGWFGTRFLEMREAGAFENAFGRVFALVEPTKINSTHLKDAEIVPLDIGDDSACANLKLQTDNPVLVHGAGLIHPKTVKDFKRVNVNGTKNVLKLASRLGANKAVLISSNSPCGCNPNPQHRFTEASPYNPYMGYGRSKMIGETIASAWATETESSLAILRPCWFFGPQQPERQTRFFRLIHGGLVPLFGDGNNVRSITYIDDLCNATFKALTNGNPGISAYWIALEKAYTMLEIIETIREVMRADFNLMPKTRNLPMPNAMATSAMIADTILQSAGIYHQEIHVLGEMNKNIACSIAKAKTELGFEPLADLREAVKRSLAWAITNGQKIS